MPGPDLWGNDGIYGLHSLKMRRQILVSKDFPAQHQKISKRHTDLSEKNAMKILVPDKSFSDLFLVEHCP